MSRAFTAIDLFCGAGGLSEGFRQAGFHILAGNDLDAAAGLTYAATHEEAKFLPGPIENISANDFLRVAGLKSGALDCLIGGPPCQAYSVYNHQRGMHDKRSNLFEQYLRLVAGLQPNWVVLENVTGITSVGNGSPVNGIISGLHRLGYMVESRILKAEEYGVPQERRRIFFVGNRRGLELRWPTPTHGPGLAPFATVADALGDLPALANGEHRGVVRYAKIAKGAYQRAMREGCSLVHNHSAPRLSPVNIERLKHIPQGGSWRDVPFHLLPEGMKKAKRSDHTKRYGRLALSGLASTILTKCDLHWGAFIHPTQERALTVREAARFQSFPDKFIFHGSRTEQFVQVGNAVPPLLGRQIAQAIVESSTAKSTVTFPSGYAVTCYESAI